MKDFDLKLAPDKSHAILTNYGEVNHDAAADRQRAMAAFAMTNAVTRFLIDTRGKEFVGSSVDLYTFAKVTLPKEGFTPAWKVALVTSPNDDSHDFLEVVCFNAGHNVKIFKNCDEAASWLTL